ncbi:MAG: NAD(P)H-dependent oxidoreductase subunit E [Candidatus Brockarchaeota archaeon]|nr:NAD(P)H-dependent oxidoreductase subunit E [Candidatus Brockarchaeota archaeon]
MSQDFRSVASEIVSKHGESRSSLILVLQEIQSKFNHIPFESMLEVSERMGVPLSDIYGVATFYHQFRLKPQGRHLISVCMGTACHVKGSQAIHGLLRERLGVGLDEETSPDGRFTLQKVRCMGACGLAPVLKIDGDIYGKVKPEDLDAILQKYS